MRWRSFRITFLAFQVVWLNAVLPGHTRGAVTLDGQLAAEPACHKACGKHEDARGKKQDGGRAKRCAICFHAARLSTAAPIDFTPARLREAGVLDVPAAEGVASVQPLHVYDGRGPPAA